ncbi:hypothetical protein PoB_000878400 [Plakobranchus ocellatus]|uniref:Uncharacterized protein n=1 Tax=Plakobranchus ocellatus TaxID=259542 RepID=A0AAV3YJ23_9GAST|nr:hypothetical protein PoB_000878400 [Plakobranchus ocellatus]
MNPAKRRSRTRRHLKIRINVVVTPCEEHEMGLEFKRGRDDTVYPSIVESTLDTSEELREQRILKNQQR